MSRYIVAQTPDSGSSWIHYLCGWYGDVPIWQRDRDNAMKLDEAAARAVVDQLDDRYKRVVRHYIEELPHG